MTPPPRRTPLALLVFLLLTVPTLPSSGLGAAPYRSTGEVGDEVAEPPAGESLARRSGAWSRARHGPVARRVALPRGADLPGVSRLATGGILGGGVGFFGLGYLGAVIADSGNDADLAAVGGFVLGGLAGEVLGVAAGVHLADQRRGSFWSDLGVSALGAAGSLAVLAMADTDGAAAWSLAGLGVAVQVGLTVGTEIGSR